MKISTSALRVQHSNAGQNIQHSVYLYNKVTGLAVNNLTILTIVFFDQFNFTSPPKPLKSLTKPKYYYVTILEKGLNQSCFNISSVIFDTRIWDFG